MKKLKLSKLIASTLVIASVLALNPLGASAEWKNNSTGWWYTEGNSYATGWKIIDGNWYYFYSDGYMAKNTTINGCYLNSKGAWVNTLNQSQKISVVYPSNWIKSSSNGKDFYYLDDKGTNVNLVIESMKGYSEEDYIKASELNIKSEFGINHIDSGVQVFNNKKARVSHYFSNHDNKNLTIFHVTFFNNNTAYIFTLVGTNKISAENMASFENMLNTVEFIN